MKPIYSKVLLFTTSLVTWSSFAHQGINNFELHAPFDKKLSDTYKNASSKQRQHYTTWRKLYTSSLNQINTGKVLTEKQKQEITSLYNKLVTYVLAPIVRAEYLQLVGYSFNVTDSHINNELHKARLSLISQFYRPNSYINMGLNNSWNNLFKQAAYAMLLAEYKKVNHAHLLSSELSCLAGSAALNISEQSVANNVYLNLTYRNAPLGKNCLIFVSQFQRQESFASSTYKEQYTNLIAYSSAQNINYLQSNSLFTNDQAKLASFVQGIATNSLFSYSNLDQVQKDVLARNLTTVTLATVKAINSTSYVNTLSKILDKFKQLEVSSDSQRNEIIDAFYKANKNIPENTYQELLIKFPSDVQTIAAIRIALRNNQDISSLLPRLSAKAQALQEWRYWKASSQGFTTNQGKSILQNLSKETGYYPMIAAKQLGIDYNPSFNHHKQFSLNKYLPWMNKAMSELYAVQDLENATKLWKTTSFNQEGVGFILYAYSQKWYFQGILSSIANRQPRELLLRFPNAYHSIYQKATKGLAVTTSFAQAIGRQESSYNSLALSSAKAHGVMQMINSTAMATAKKHNIPYKLSKLYDLDYNIKLGSLHLSDLFEKYKNRAYVSVAYNAGPSRITQWNKGNLTFDRYVASIPFTETRNYVQNVLTFDFYIRYLHGSYDKTTITNDEWNMTY